MTMHSCSTHVYSCTPPNTHTHTHTQVPFDRIQFFDDDRRNIAAAVEVGIRAVWTAPFEDAHLDLVSEHVGETITAD